MIVQFALEGGARWNDTINLMFLVHWNVPLTLQLIFCMSLVNEKKVKCFEIWNLAARANDRYFVPCNRTAGKARTFGGDKREPFNLS